MPLKNPGPEVCAACNENVKLTEGVQCQGPCGKWRHYRCLDVSACKIQAVKTGELVLRCPCPDCEPTTQCSISWQAPCYKGQPCPTSKGSRSSTIATNIDTTIETTSYKQLPDQMPNECRLSQCISPTTCPPCPLDSDELYTSKVGSKGKKQKILLEVIPGGKSGPGEGTINQEDFQDSDRRNRDHDDDRRRSQRDAEVIDRDPSKRSDGKHRSSELTKADSNTYRGDKALGGNERGYGGSDKVGSFERGYGSERGYGLERGYGSERGYAGGGSDKTGRMGIDLLRKSAGELKSNAQDLRMKQEVVMKCFESVRMLFEAVDNLSMKINEVVENVIVALEENDTRYISRRPSVDSRGKMCFCPQNSER